ncbi:MAG: hypothetical protein JKY54_04900 [Flavobacteriales bacterium]|nr:hypothetical protein [Flavobacteriales bacterium]
MSKTWQYYRTYYLDDAKLDKLILRWNRGFNDLEVIHEKQRVGKFESSRELFHGTSFQLKNGEMLFVRALPKSQFEIIVNHKHIQESGGHPRKGLEGLLALFLALIILNLVHLVLMIALYPGGYQLDVIIDSAFIVLIIGSVFLVRQGFIAGNIIVAGLYVLWCGLIILNIQQSMALGVIMLGVYSLAIFGCIRYIKKVRKLGRHLRKKKSVSDILDQ